MACDPKQILSDLDVAGEATSTNSVPTWAPSINYTLGSQRIYENIFYINILAITDMSTTTPDMDATHWSPAGTGGGSSGPTEYVETATVTNSGATLNLTLENAGTQSTLVFTPSSGGGSGYVNNLLGAGSLLTKVALFLGTEGATVVNADPLLTYTTYTTNSTAYHFFPNRDSGNGQWSDNTNPVASGAVTINLIG